MWVPEKERRVSLLVWFGFLILGNNMTQFPPKYRGLFMSPKGVSLLKRGVHSEMVQEFPDPTMNSLLPG